MTDEVQAIQITPREMDVLRLLCAGVTSYADLTEALCMSPNTLNWHLDQLRTKFGVSERAQIIGYALVHGLLEVRAQDWRGSAA